MISVSITLIYYAVFSFAGGRGPFVALMIAAAFLGIHRGAGSALVNSTIGEFIEPEKRAASLALVGAVMHGGSGVVAVIAGWVAAGNDGANWPIAHYIGFISIITLTIFAFIMPKKPDQKALPDNALQPEVSENKETLSTIDVIKKGVREIPHKVFLMMLLHLVFVVCIISFNLYSSIYIISEHQLGTSVEAGLVSSTLTIFTLLSGLTYSYWGRLFRKWIVPVGYILSALGLIIKLVFTTHIAGIWVAAAFVGIGWNLANPYISSQVMSLSPQKFIPVAISVHLGFQNLGMFLAPYVLRLGGGIFGGGISGSLMVAAVSIPVLTVLAYFLFTKEKHTENRKSA